ncbi:hypothetical protein PIB30_114883, partial [Stylosanthes scabra]|nr:hypothetical protein [Stylosanthes scabra]
MNVYQFDRSRSAFTVEEFEAIQGSRQARSYQVLLQDRKCDCGYFQALHIPCRHALAVCSLNRWLLNRGDPELVALEPAPALAPAPRPARHGPLS